MFAVCSQDMIAAFIRPVRFGRTSLFQSLQRFPAGVLMQTILIQFDTDAQPSVFDRVVAVDAGVAQLFSYSGVTPQTVTPLVHGAMFTRGPADLKHTAIFIGGSSAAAGEALLKQVRQTFFGPLRVSVMMDSNGCNTTAAAAVASLRRHTTLAGQRAVVLGGTGPVGQRAAELLAMENAAVTLVSRSRERSVAACEAIIARLPSAQITPAAAETAEQCEVLCQGQQVIIAAGAAGVCFLPEGALGRISGLQAVADLNAVPPTGLGDVKPGDKAEVRHGVTCYGALGVGGLKMKVHRRAVASLFEASDRVLEAAQIYELAKAIAGIT